MTRRRTIEILTNMCTRILCPSCPQIPLDDGEIEEALTEAICVLKQRTTGVNCNSCRYYMYEEIADGWVCLNEQSEHCADWTDFCDYCDVWEKRNISLREFREKYENGAFDRYGINIVEAAGWLNWECEIEELYLSLDDIWDVVKGISNDYILDQYRICFENFGKDIHKNSRNVIHFKPLYVDHPTPYFNIEIYKDEQNQKQYQLYCNDNELNAELITTNVEEIQSWINNRQSIDSE